MEDNRTMKIFFYYILTILFLLLCLNVICHATEIVLYDDFNRSENPINGWTKIVDDGTTSFVAWSNALGILYAYGDSTGIWKSDNISHNVGDFSYYFTAGNTSQHPILTVLLRNTAGDNGYKFTKQLGTGASYIMPDPWWYIISTNNCYNMTSGEVLKFELRGTSTHTTVDAYINTTLVFSAAVPVTEYNDPGNIGIGLDNASNNSFFALDDLYVDDISTETNTPTYTPTYTPTATPTYSYTPTNSPTPTASPTYSYTPTNSPTPTNTPTYTITPSYSITPTITPSSSITPTNTPTITPSITCTITPSYTITPTSTPTATPTNTPVVRYYYQHHGPMPWLLLGD
jgi:hypothetical protein